MKDSSWTPDGRAVRARVERLVTRRGVLAVLAIAAAAGALAAGLIGIRGDGSGVHRSAVSAGDCSFGGPRSAARVWHELALEAIRRDEPTPTAHSRNLYHLSAAMWDAWAAFDPASTAVFVDEQATSTDPAQARDDAVSLAAFVVLGERYVDAVGGPDTLEALRSVLVETCGLDYDDRIDSNSAAAVGVRVARGVLAATADDGSLERSGYKDPSYRPSNPPLEVAEPGTVMVDPNRWQPLTLAPALTVDGLPHPGGEQSYEGAQWGHVETFAIPAATATGLPLDPGPPPRLTDPGFTEGVVHVVRASAGLEAGTAAIDISPAVMGNSPPGSDGGSGHAVNPATGHPYDANIVDQADYARAIAEYWADGPQSETPPGHWNLLANDVSDAVGASGDLWIGGTGAAVDRLEWDVKLYLALNGALHDAAVAAWGVKRHYDYARPISMIRYLGGRGELPHVDGLIETITADSARPGERHAHLATFVGEVAVYAWRGAPADPRTETSGVGWIRAVEWVPYQQPTFVTPSFPGYVSGHSAFSRAGADVLTAFTGSRFFPGGIHRHVVAEGSLLHEEGPTRTFELQWATYQDAADEAGRSRIWGGIHVPVDDYPGRLIGARCAEVAWARAQALFGA